MGSSDIPPAHSPQWLIPLHTALLGIGVLLWDATYILMTRRALATRTYGMPLLALAANVSWEVVTVFYVCEAPLETFGFLFWLLLDVGLVYTTLKYGEENWRSSGGWSWVGRRIGWVFSALLVLGGIGNYWFASWWLAVEGRGSGTKAGKWWRGREGYDTTELAFWSAGVSQVVLSACSLSMLTSRGHSGGTSYTIWFCRAMGTLNGLVLCNLVMWWYWPEAHEFIVSPLAAAVWGTSLACDAAYPFLLWRVRRTERILPNGQVVRGDETKQKSQRTKHGKKQD